MPALPVHVPKDYDAFLRGLKLRIKDAQLRASLSVNRELIFLYWQIGRDILARQKTEGWGAKIVERLAKDLRVAFPDMSGFSRTNLMSMRAFAGVYPDESIVQQLVGQLPWGHNVILIDRVKNADVRLWYARQTIQFGWSRNILAHQIETDLHGRQGKALTNFDKTLPAVDDLLRHADDQPSIGIILCKTKSKTIAEYALRDTHKPIGISEYRTLSALPESLRKNLPTIQELEAELRKSKARPPSRK